MSKFIWEEDEAVVIVPPELRKLDDEIAKVEAQLRAAGVTEEEEAALAEEPFTEDEK